MRLVLLIALALAVGVAGAAAAASARRNGALPGRDVQLLEAPLRDVLAPWRRRAVAERERLAAAAPAASRPAAPSCSGTGRRRAECVRSARPDRHCSPGAYYSRLTKRVICSSSFRTGAIRNVPQAEKFRVEREYGMRRGVLRRHDRDRPHRPARARRLERDREPLPRARQRRRELPRQGRPREPREGGGLRRAPLTPRGAAGFRAELGGALPLFFGHAPS